MRSFVMTGYETYCLHQALIRHFTSDTYSYFKFNGKFRGNSKEIYDGNRHKQLYEKLGKKFSKKAFVTLFVANIFNERGKFVGDLLTREANELYLQRAKVLESLTYTFENDLRTIFKEVSVKDAFKTEKGQIPILLNMYLAEKISAESFIIITELTGLDKKYDLNLGDDPIWKSIKFRLDKYREFLYYDRTSFIKKMREILESHIE